MADLMFTYLHIGLMGSVMILAVLLARPLLRKAPRNITCLLWLLVALRLLIPFQLESPLSLQPLSETTSVMDWAEESPATDHTPMAELSAAAPSESVQLEEPVIKKHIQTEIILSIVWGCGILAVALYACVSYGVLQYRVRDAVKAPDDAWESDRISGAFLLGYITPRVCIPTGLNPRDRSFILAHENAHRKRGDHWWKLLGMLCLSIHWYNPLVWLAYALLCRDIEVSCDQHVIRNLELEERKSYSFALLNCGKRLSGFLTYPVAFGEISLKSRIKNVLNYHQPSLWIKLLSFTVAGVIAICFMTTPTAANPTQPEEISGSVHPIPQTTNTTPPTNTTEPETQPPKNPTTPPQPVTEAPVETTVPTETEPAMPKPTEPKPTEPEVTQTTVTEPETEEIVIPSVPDIDFSEAERLDTAPQLPTFEPPSVEEEENLNRYGDSEGISLIPKEPVKTGVDLPRVPIWEDISPKPGYPTFP